MRTAQQFGRSGSKGNLVIARPFGIQQPTLHCLRSFELSPFMLYVQRHVQSSPQECLKVGIRLLLFVICFTDRYPLESSDPFSQSAFRFQPVFRNIATMMWRRNGSSSMSRPTYRSRFRDDKDTLVKPSSCLTDKGTWWKSFSCWSTSNSHLPTDEGFDDVDHGK